MSQNEARVLDSFNTPPSEGEELRFRAYGVGIDCHSKFIQVCVLTPSESGHILRFEHTAATTMTGLSDAKSFILRTLHDCPDAVAALDNSVGFAYTIESTGCYHLPVIAKFGGTPSVVNPLLASAARRKTDVLDARLLAYNALTGIWPSSYIPSQDVQILRVLINMREDAGRMATRATNRLNNFLLRFGHTLGSQTPVRTMAGRAIVEDLIAGTFLPSEGVAETGLPDEVKSVFTELYAQFDRWEQNKKIYERRATEHMFACEFLLGTGEVVKGKRVSELLRTIPGFGPMAVLYWASEVCTTTRFPNPKSLSAYAGCDPTLKISAGKVTETVRRKGNQKLHQSLTKAAQSLVVRATDPLGQWGKRIWMSRKRGGFKTAVSAVARRMVEASFHVMQRGEPFTMDGYKFHEAPDVVRDIPIENLLPKRFTRLFGEIKTTGDLADAYYSGRLAKVEGVGDRCLAQVRTVVLESAVKRPRASATAFSSRGKSSDAVRGSSAKRPQSTTASSSETQSTA